MLPFSLEFEPASFSLLNLPLLPPTPNSFQVLSVVSLRPCLGRTQQPPLFVLQASMLPIKGSSSTSTICLSLF